MGTGPVQLPATANGVLHPDASVVIPGLPALQRSLGSRQRPSEPFRASQEAALAESSELVAPAFAWARMDAPGLAELAGAPAAIVGDVEALLGVVCTIGAGLEARVRDHFAAQAYTRGYLLDQAGTLAVARLARYAADQLCTEQHAERWAPGDDEQDRRLDAQRLLFAQVPAHLIGVHLTEHNVMAPAKSLSFFLFICSGPSGMRCLAACRRCLWQGSCERERGGRRPDSRKGQARHADV